MAIAAQKSVFPSMGNALSTASERNGTWSKALKVPGLTRLNAGGNAQIRSLSCPSAGNCFAVGDYTSGGTAGSTLIERWNGASWTIMAQLLRSSRSFTSVRASSSRRGASSLAAL